MMPDHTIRVTDEIWLSPLEAADKERCVEYLNDAEIASRLLRLPHPYGATDFDTFFELAERKREDLGHPLNYIIRHQSHGLIGGFGFETVTPGHSLEIGYWLAKPFWGQGIMTAVVGAACEFAVEQWDIVRITANVFTFNDASARVLEKNGFVFEGLLQKRYRKGDQFIDSRLFALIR